MILFFYGDDSYRIHQQIKKLKEKFISASLGDTNLAEISGKTANYSEIVRQILAMPFLSKTRLVIIENILSEGKAEIKEKIQEILKKVPKSTILLFSETKIDKRLGLYKKLMKSDKVQEFKLLDEDQLRRWIKNEVENRGGIIESAAIIKLIEYVGNDLWRLNNEIDKLITYKKEIEVSSIEQLVQSKIDKDIFQLIEAIGQKNLKKALKEAQALVTMGENELYILSMIVYGYRNLLILKDLSERTKTTSSWDLAKASGLHPFVVQKTINQLNNFSMQELKNSYKTLLDYDSAIKTGKMESKTALTLLIVKLIRQKDIKI